MITTKRQATRLATNRERVVKIKRHDPLCLGLPSIEGLAQGSCTCDRKGHGHAIVLKENNNG